MSSHFSSIVAASHPLQTFDAAVVAAGTTASKGTKRGKMETFYTASELRQAKHNPSIGLRAGRETHMTDQTVIKFLNARRNC